jgi:hypothetical protein
MRNDIISLCVEIISAGNIYRIYIKRERERERETYCCPYHIVTKTNKTEQYQNDPSVYKSLVLHLQALIECCKLFASNFFSKFHCDV